MLARRSVPSVSSPAYYLGRPAAFWRAALQPDAVRRAPEKPARGTP